MEPKGDAIVLSAKLQKCSHLNRVLSQRVDQQADIIRDLRQELDAAELRLLADKSRFANVLSSYVTARRASSSASVLSAVHLALGELSEERGLIRRVFCLEGDAFVAWRGFVRKRRVVGEKFAAISAARRVQMSALSLRLWRESVRVKQISRRAAGLWGRAVRTQRLEGAVLRWRIGLLSSKAVGLRQVEESFVQRTKELADLRATVAAMEGDGAALRHHFATQRERGAAEAAALREEVARLREKVECLEEIIKEQAALEDSLGALKEEYFLLSNQTDDSARKAASLDQALAQQRQENAALRSENERLQAQVSTATSMVIQTQREVEAMREEIVITEPVRMSSLANSLGAISRMGGAGSPQWGAGQGGTASKGGGDPKVRLDFGDGASRSPPRASTVGPKGRSQAASRFDASELRKRLENMREEALAGL
jgi:hypothetical protein